MNPPIRCARVAIFFINYTDREDIIKDLKPLSVGVIGVGHLGSLHAKMLSEIPTAKLVGVYDSDAVKAAELAREYSTSSFASAGELLAKADAVCIATPTSTHFEVARDAIERGLHVFVEKPICSTVGQAQILTDLADKENVKLQVGHIERFNPALLAIDQFELQPMFIESHRLAQFNPRGTDVAVVLDLMIHDIDIILSLVKSELTEVHANGVAVVSDTIDIANARLQFVNGCVANVTASRISQRKMRKMRMFQKDAYISVDFSDGVTEVYRLVDYDDATSQGTMMLGEIDRGSVKRKVTYEQPQVKEINALKHELELFIDSIRRNVDPPVTGRDGLRALQVAQRIIEKIGTQTMPVA